MKMRILVKNDKYINKIIKYQPTKQQCLLNNNEIIKRKIYKLFILYLIYSIQYIIQYVYRLGFIEFKIPNLNLHMSIGSTSKNRINCKLF